MLAPEDFKAISDIMKAEIAPLNKRMIGIEKLLSATNYRIENVEDILEEIRSSINRFLEWANKVEDAVSVLSTQ